MEMTFGAFFSPANDEFNERERVGYVDAHITTVHACVHH